MTATPFILVRKVVTYKDVFTRNRNLMKCGYFESQKPTRDDRSWVNVVAEAGVNVNYDAIHFDIHKTIAYRINNRSVKKKLAGHRQRSGRQNKRTPLEERLIQITSRRKRFLTANSLCITSRNCPWYVSIDQNHPELSAHGGRSQYWHFVLLKTVLTGTVLHTNEFLQRCMTYLVLNKTVITFVL